MKKFLFLSAMVSLFTLLEGQAATTHTVDIINFAFTPATLTIQPGDTVMWMNQDDFQHTSTSGNGTPDGNWDSGLLNRNDMFLRTFTTAGTFPYYCIPHGLSMAGTITVQAPNTAPSVSIDSPTNNTSYPAPTNITITATATDTGGSVTQVAFFDGTNSLGVDSSNPFSVPASLTTGGHQLTAVATDNSGLSTTSAVVNVSVASVPLTNPIAARVPKGDLTIELETVADGLASPLGLADPNDGSGRLFVYDQSGLVYLVRPGTRVGTPLLDVRNRLVTLGAYDERGLLGLALHPQFTNNALLYTYTSEPVSGAAHFPASLPAGVNANHQSVIAEWRVDPANSNRVDLASRREIMRIDKPQSNHNGGTMRFGLDGFLYVALGDGGAADDQGDGHSPIGNGQDTNSILGKIIRIDVTTPNPVNGRYSIPSDNPFVGRPGLDEIYAYGFRNPFMFSFDRNGGGLYAGDVGQNRLEEIDLVVKGGNYGWNLKEGTFYFDPNGTGAGFVTAAPRTPVPADLIDPIAQYDHDDGLAVVGGYVYRGAAIPQLQGRYVTGDWGTFSTPSGRLFYLDASNTVTEFRIGLEDRPLNFWLKGFGEDAAGEIYVLVSRVLGPSGNTGRMMKLVASSNQLNVAGIGKSGSNIVLTVEGGIGPFALQKKNAVTDSNWFNRSFSASRSVTNAAEGRAGFFRVRDTAHQPAIPMTAVLSGLMERPNGLTNTAFGSATLSLEDNTLRFEINYGGLSGPATAAHFHGPAPAATATNVIIDLSPYNGGAYGSNGTVSGVVLLTPAQKAMFLAGQTYINFHTGVNPGGEMRGQVAPVMMESWISPANERPNPVLNSGGSGFGSFILVGTNLTFNIRYQNLSAPATAGHIHGPATDATSTNVLIDLAPFNGGAWSSNGVITGSVNLTFSQLAAVIDGLTYVNLHTANHPAGEMRGQIRPLSTAVPLTASMSGLAERPTSLTNSATGLALFSLEGSKLSFNIRYEGLSGPATAAHIHGPAPASTATGVLVNFAPFNGGSYGAAGVVSGSVMLTDLQKSYLLSGQTYVNFHTGINPGGEMRGQISPVLLQTSLSGNNERPDAVITPASGSGLLTLVGDRLGFNVSYRALTGVATASHIHGPASAFATASPMVEMAPFNGGAYGTNGNLSGSVQLTPNQLGTVIDGLTYLNFHTGNNPNGEIRGQINRQGQ